jgi:predicted nucleotidyltransferase
MITHKQIISKLKERLEPLFYIYALWLEGSYANGMADEFSDIDIWIDVEDDFEAASFNAVEKALSELGEIDINDYVGQEHPKLRQRVYHIKGSSEYLMIDFNLQLHSRDSGEYVYIKDSRVETAVAVFDKANIVKYTDLDPGRYYEWNKKRLDECLYRYGQHSRVIKYVRRGLYLEAYAYYNRYVFEPLIYILPLIYTPANADYYLVHISQHIPEQELNRLEYFARIPSMEYIERKTYEAETWLRELLKMLPNENPV